MVCVFLFVNIFKKVYCVFLFVNDSNCNSFDCRQATTQPPQTSTHAPCTDKFERVGSNNECKYRKCVQGVLTDASSDDRKRHCGKDVNDVNCHTFTARDGLTVNDLWYVLYIFKIIIIHKYCICFFFD